MRKLGVLIAILVFLTAGCTSTTPQKVRIAEDGSPSGAGFYIAHARGYFAAQGLDVEIKPFESSGDMLPAIASGDIDVAGGITGANLFNAVARGLDIRIIADKGTNYPGRSYFNVVVRKDLTGEIKEYADLKGLRDYNDAFRKGKDLDEDRANGSVLQDVPLDKIIDMSRVDRAVKQLGEYQ